MTIMDIDKTSLLTDESRVKEVARYMGLCNAKEIPRDIRDMIDSAMDEVRDAIAPKAIFAKSEISVNDKDESTQFLGFVTNSTPLFHNLYGCREAYFLAVTIGCAFDLLLRRAQSKGCLSYAQCLQAVGAMYCECTVDYVNNHIKKMVLPKSTRPRFSPGYGGVSLLAQKAIFGFLDCKKIGLTLMDTLVMAPEKSVTAIIGIVDKD